MLWQASELDGYDIAATDGAIGRLDDLLFDDAHWTVRWMAVDTGGALGERIVLLAPAAFGMPDAKARRLPVSLTRRQVEESPPITVHEPLSRESESELFRHYGLTPYWETDLGKPLGYLSSGAPFLSGFLFPPRPDLAAAGAKPSAAVPEPQPRDPHLQSVGEVEGHAIRASDGDIGHVEDFLVEDGSWAIRYMIVDTRNWLPGRRVLVSPHWVSAIDWAEKRIQVDLTRKAIEDSPDYDPTKPIPREGEERLHRHYGREGYWRG
jgi:hypothetical protein